MALGNPSQCLPDKRIDGGNGDDRDDGDDSTDNGDNMGAVAGQSHSQDESTNAHGVDPALNGRGGRIGQRRATSASGMHSQCVFT